MGIGSDALAVNVLPRDSLQTDVDELGRKIELLAAGQLSEVEFRAFRVPMGIYEQRESGTYMMRCRFAAGVISPAKLRALAGVALQYGNGILHVTSRQDVQVHRLQLTALQPALQALCDAGIATRAGGGNTVRNVTACALAGVCAAEAFDVTRSAESMSASMLKDPLSMQLPRKYKMAFSGCASDCAAAMMSDLGFVARSVDGAEGFSVYVGGGLGARSRVAALLEAFVPRESAHAVAEAVKRVFDRHGNRRNRNQARLRFLIERIGLAELRRLYLDELRSLGADRASWPAVDGMSQAAPALPAPGPAWAPSLSGSDVVAQRQIGRSTVVIGLALGDLAAGTAELLAGIAERYGDGTLRATQGQDLLLRDVADIRLKALRRELASAGLVRDAPPILSGVTVCAGASTCRLGICRSRGLAGAISQAIQGSGLDMARIGRLRLHISGCPNACGRHPVAQIGLFGVAKRIGARLVPHYVVQLGGQLGVGRARLAEGRWAIPARAVPAYVVDLLKAYEVSGGSDLDRFIGQEAVAVADRLAARHEAVPAFEADPSYYYDWTAQEPFSLAGRGPGECGAGVFDLIEVDLASAAEALAAGQYHRATVLAARALLVTRGEQPTSDGEALAAFARLFVAEALVQQSFWSIVEQARTLAESAERETRFRERAADAAALVAAVRALYDGMDSSLRFNAQRAGTVETVAPGHSEAKAAYERDFRGVACPLNYVKTKLVLDGMPGDASLLVLLDEQGARNVPESVQKDGHKVVSVERTADHWRVLIRKAG